MAKKFGKFILFTAAAAAACAGVYYYFQKKEQLAASDDCEDEDYDDFSEDLDEDANRSYVSLNLDEAVAEETEAGEAPFEKLSDLVSDASEKVEEKVEEFFDEDDESSSVN
ncbi:MAG: hypothetical protein ACI4EQ_02590 [Lachnospiraceae bacterium]